MGRVDGKVAVITGTTSGIGKGTAWVFAREGAKVVMGARRVERGEKIEKEMRESGLDAMFVKTDVTVKSECTNLIEKAVERYGRVDILVNVSGIGGLRRYKLHEVDDEFRDLVFKTNLFGMMDMCRAAIPYMLKQKSGSIVNVSSIAALHACKNDCLYSAVKGAVNMLSVTMAHDYARDGIRVNVVCPGFTRSEITDRFFNDGSGFAESKLEQLPIGRIADAEEIGQGILYLASDEGSFAVGSILTLDGGELL